MDAEKAREISILRQILSAAESLKSPGCTQPTPSSQSPVACRLPNPPSISEKLLSTGVDPALADKLSARYNTRSHEIRATAESLLKQACTEIAGVSRDPSLLPLPRLLNSLIEAHTQRYLKTVNTVEDKVFHAVTLMLEKRSAPVQSPRSLPQDRKVSPKFNHEFTPHLQQYFAYNAFPSPVERAEMARKSGMEARQIEVWFQNHRRRARQEGQTLRRVRPSSRGLSPTELDEKMDPAFIIPEERRLEIDDEAEEVGTSSDEETDSSVSSPAASHAGMEHNPLEMVMSTPGLAPRRTYETMDEIASSGRTWSFAPPTWAVRAPAPERSAPPSIAALTAAFARLTVWDVGRSAGARFCLPTAYTPPRAPLPAFVRAANKFAPHPVQSCVARTTELCVAAAGPRATATGTTKIKKSKKVSGPPRRTPTRSSRSASPAWSERSESGYSSSASRTPSLSVSRRSSSSDLSSMPGTPPSGPLPLPFSFRFGGTEKA